MDVSNLPSQVHDLCIYVLAVYKSYHLFATYLTINLSLTTYTQECMHNKEESQHKLGLGSKHLEVEEM